VANDCICENGYYDIYNITGSYFCAGNLIRLELSYEFFRMFIKMFNLRDSILKLFKMLS